MSDDTWAVTHANGRIYHDEYFRKYCTWCLEKQAMASVNDWAAKAAKQIYTEIDDPYILDEEHIAAIITTHAKPLVALLKEARRKHKTDCDYITHPKLWTLVKISGEPCTCGADAWNARLDAALAGEKKPVTR